MLLCARQPGKFNPQYLHLFGALYQKYSHTHTHTPGQKHVARFDFSTELTTKLLAFPSRLCWIIILYMSAKATCLIKNKSSTIIIKHLIYKVLYEYVDVIDI